MEPLLNQNKNDLIFAQFYNCQQGLEGIKNNSVFDWLEKESMQFVMCPLTMQAKKLQSIDKLFLVTKRGFKRLYEGGFEHCQM